MPASFVQVPRSAIFARYAPAPGGGVQVVAVSGQVLGASFFEIRSKFSFVSSVLGAGGWVVLAPSAIQPSLF